MWDLPGPGLEPVSPALVGGFLTTAPQGSPPLDFFKKINISPPWHIKCLGLLDSPNHYVFFLSPCKQPFQPTDPV